MKTKENILSQMFEEMPFDVPNKKQIKPYIMEAMEIYAKEIKNYDPLLIRINSINEHKLCCCDNPNAFKEMENGYEFCTQCKKPY